MVIEALFADSYYRHARRSRLAARRAYGHFAFDNDTSSKLETDLNLRSAYDNGGRFYSPHIRKKKEKNYATKPVGKTGTGGVASPPRLRSPFANFLHMAHSFLRFLNDISTAALDFYRELNAICFIYQT